MKIVTLIKKIQDEIYWETKKKWRRKWNKDIRNSISEMFNNNTASSYSQKV